MSENGRGFSAATSRPEVRPGVYPEFVRLFHGRLWHVARPRLEFAGAEEDAVGAAFCGESWPVRGDRRPEVLSAQIPDGGALCVRCVAEVNAYRNTVLGVGARDRRQAMRDLWPTLLDGYDDVVDAEIVCGTCGQPERECTCSAEAPTVTPEPSTGDLVGLAAAPDVGTDEWSCGSCGHPNLDHPGGTCTVTNDAFDAAVGEPLGPCECRGLTRAG